MRREIAIGMAFALGGCAAGGGVPPPPAPLAGDREQPVLALFEYVLTGYYAGAGPGPLTTCAKLSPSPLSPEQELALITRFVRLAPAERCDSSGPETVDTITGDIAQVVQVYEFACTSPTLCSGWVQEHGPPATRYVLRFESGAWRFDSDRRIIAE